MNKMKAIKLLFIFLCFVMIATVSVTVFASDWITLTPDTQGNGATTAGTIGGKIVGILRVVGIIISVVVIMILGIKYMMGSAEEKAEYKKTFVPYLIGALLLFGASAFANQIYQFASSITA